MNEQTKFANNQIVQDFKHKGIFESKEEILTRLNLSNISTEQDEINSDDLFDFKKSQVTNTETENLSETDEYEQMVKKSWGKPEIAIHQELKQLRNKELDFDFKNDIKNHSRITEIESELAEIQKKQHAATQQEKLADIKDTVFPIAAFIGRCLTVFVLGGFLITMTLAVYQNNKEHANTTETTVVAKETKATTENDEKKPISKEIANAMLLDGIAKQVAMSQAQFLQQTPQANINQMSRIGQKVLDLAKSEKPPTPIKNELSKEKLDEIWKAPRNTEISIH